MLESASSIPKFVVNVRAATQSVLSASNSAGAYSNIFANIRHSVTDLARIWPTRLCESDIMRCKTVLDPCCMH
jgi:hypothetical protein